MGTVWSRSRLRRTVQIWPPNRGCPSVSVATVVRSKCLVVWALPHRGVRVVCGGEHRSGMNVGSVDDLEGCYVGRLGISLKVCYATDLPSGPKVLRCSVHLLWALPQKSFLWAIDTRKLWCRANHSIKMNAHLQSQVYHLCK